MDRSGSVGGLAVPVISGVYAFVNLVNGKVYVGSSVDIHKRKRWHIRDLRGGRHHSRYFQRAWNKYGESAFEWRVLECCSKEKCIACEQYWIDYYDAANRERGYNISPTAGSMIGMRHTEETKRNMSKARSGRIVSSETRRKISEALKSNKKLSESRRGRRPFAGHKHSEETRKKIGESLMGREVSRETRIRLSKSLTGRHFSEESKRKMSISRRAYFARKHGEPSPSQGTLF